MTRYLNTPMLLLSLSFGTGIGGLAIAVALYLESPTPYAWGLVVGALAAILFSFVLNFIAWRSVESFKEAESRVEGAVLYRGRVMMTCGKLRRNAFIFITGSRIYLYLWDKRPYLETYADREGLTVERTGEHMPLVLRFTDREAIFLFTVDEEIVKTLSSQGYKISYPHKD